MTGSEHPRAANGIPILGLVLLALLAPATHAQRLSLGDAGTLSFDAASIKPHAGDRPKSLGTGAPGRFEATAVSLHDLIAAAYGGLGGRLIAARIVDEPKWADSELFDINAKTPGDEGLDKMFEMLKTLLRDRFSLKVEVVQRELPVYALTTAKRDGKPGPRLKPSGIDCAVVTPQVLATGHWPPGVEWCGFRYERGEQVHTDARGITMAELGRRLEQSPDIARPVLDRTALKGTFDFAFDYAPLTGPADAARAGANIFTALQEQLGLKLDSMRGAVDVVVVRQAKLPSPD